MNQSGSLKKRRIRTLTKIAGLGIIPYETTSDTYDGSDLFHSPRHTEDFKIVKSQKRSASRSSRNTSITISRVLPTTEEEIVGNRSRGVSPSRSRDSRLHDTIMEEDFEDESPGQTNQVLPIGDGGDDWSERSFPLSPMIMKFLQFILWSTASIFLLPWNWNKKTCRIDLWENELMRKFQRKFHILFTIQNFFMMIFQLNLVRKNFLVATTHRGVFMHMLLARFVVDKTVFKEEKRWLFAYTVPEFYLHVPISLIRFASEPLAFFYLFSYIYTPELGWYWKIPGLIQDYLFMTMTMSGDMLTLWTLLAHTSTTDFWLTESHKNNETGETKEELRQPKVAIEVYKTLLLLTEYFNDCMATLGIAILKTVGITGLIVCFYVLIRTTGEDFVNEFPVILTYFAGVPACTSIALLTLHLSAKVFDLGVSFIHCWDNTRQKSLRRILMSCPTIKIRMGSFYFITVSTTKKYFQTLIGYLIDAIVTLP